MLSTNYTDEPEEKSSSSSSSHESDEESDEESTSSSSSQPAGPVVEHFTMNECIKHLIIQKIYENIGVAGKANIINYGNWFIKNLETDTTNLQQRYELAHNNLKDDNDHYYYKSITLTVMQRECIYHILSNLGIRNVDNNKIQKYQQLNKIDPDVLLKRVLYQYRRNEINCSTSWTGFEERARIKRRVQYLQSLSMLLLLFIISIYYCYNLIFCLFFFKLLTGDKFGNNCNNYPQNQGQYDAEYDAEYDDEDDDYDDDKKYKPQQPTLSFKNDHQLFYNNNKRKCSKKYRINSTSMLYIYMMYHYYYYYVLCVSTHRFIHYT